MKNFISITICISLFWVFCNNSKIDNKNRVKSKVSTNIAIKINTGTATIGTTGDVGNT